MASAEPTPDPSMPQRDSNRFLVWYPVNVAALVVVLACATFPIAAAT